MKKILFVLIFYLLIISCSGKNPMGVPTVPENTNNLVSETANGSSPVAGDNGKITITKTENTSLEINWQQATDDATPAESLRYQVYYSLSENIGDVTLAEANGIIAKPWASNKTSCTITGLTENTRYYINILVRDTDDNKASYKTVSGITNGGADTSPPTVSTLSIASTGFTSVQLDWKSATDNTTSQSNLQYKLVYSTTSASINTVELANTNGTTFLYWSKSINTKILENLNYSTTYYFALIVKDEAGNMSLYNIVSATTKAFESKIYFQNGMGAYYITDIGSRYSTTDSWTVLRSGYPYVNPTQDSGYPSTTPQYIITKPSYWFRYKVVSHDWAAKQITGLLPGKIYRITFYDNTFSLYRLDIVGSY
jgi:hypothetical protein